MTRRRRLVWIAGSLAALIVIGMVALQFVDEPIRRSIERRMNENLVGYSARVASVKVHFFGLWIDLRDVSVRQDRHPDPPVLLIPRLTASVQWESILTGRLVADCRFEHPAAHLDLAQLSEEATDQVPMDERGWQDALQTIYPLKINELEVNEGTLSYQDLGDPKPLQASRIFIRAEDIRSVRPESGEMPSTFRAGAVVFDRGRVRMSGRADFLLKPYPAVAGNLAVEKIDLVYLESVARHLSLRLKGGEFGATGRFVYAPGFHTLDLDRLDIAHAEVDYVTSPATQEQEALVKKAAARAIHVVANDPKIELVARKIVMTDCRIGYVNENRDPSYDLFLTGADLEVTDFGNRPEHGEGVMKLRGRFMGSGETKAEARFFPGEDSSNFKASLEIQNTQLRDINDLLRAYVNFDVVAGTMSFYTEVTVRDGWASGYVKPLFRNIDIYDHAQDHNKGFFHRTYERLAGGLAKWLRNPKRHEVATITSLSGPVGNTQTNRGEVIRNLLRNAFIKAILPGFRHEAELGSKEKKGKPRPAKQQSKVAARAS